MKFIDQGGAVALADGLEQRTARTVVTRTWVQLFEQLTEAHLSAALAAKHEFLAAPMAEMEQHRFSGSIHQVCDRSQQLRLRQRHPVAMGCSRHLGEGPGVEIFLQFGLGQNSVVPRCLPLKAVDPALHFLQSIRFGFEAVGAVGQRQAFELGCGRG